MPTDGSPASWRAFEVALALAERCNVDVRVVEIAADPADARAAKSRLDAELNRRGPFPVEVIADLRLTAATVAAEINTLLTLRPGSVVVMSSHGRGRSASIVGSVTEDLLHRTRGPVLLVGPHAVVDDFSGRIVVTVDGSEESERALPVASTWATTLRSVPWVVHVAQPSRSSDKVPDVPSTAYPARLAQGLAQRTGQPVEFDELHDRDPSTAVTDFATSHEASLIIAMSHGRSGLSRLALGSVTAGFVRHATCPVLVMCLAPGDRVVPLGEQAVTFDSRLHLANPAE